MRTVFNLVGFQLVWMASVWGAANAMWWLGPLAVAMFATAHFGFRQAVEGDLKLIAWALLIGALVDTAFAASGVLRYASPVPRVELAPLWILSMWIGFALTLNHSMAFLRGKLWLQILFGALGGPVAYLIAGRVWGAVTFGTTLTNVILLLALAWGIVTPLLLFLANHKQSSASAR